MSHCSTPVAKVTAASLSGCTARAPLSTPPAPMDMHHCTTRACGVASMSRSGSAAPGPTPPSRATRAGPRRSFCSGTLAIISSTSKRFAVRWPASYGGRKVRCSAPLPHRRATPMPRRLAGVEASRAHAPAAAASSSSAGADADARLIEAVKAGDLAAAQAAVVGEIRVYILDCKQIVYMPTSASFKAVCMSPAHCRGGS